MLELRAISKHYSSIVAVSEVSFAAKPGEVTGYLGPNGSGKSTTMKIIAGLLDPTDGEVLYNGRPIAKDLISYKRLLGYVPEEPHLYTHLTGAEYMELVGTLQDIPSQDIQEKTDGLLSAFSLYEDRYVPIASYSKGMRQKVLLAAALMHNPELVLLDEPFSGLDVNSALILRSVIQELSRRGKVVLFSSHELDTVERVCSQVVILHRGRVVANDTINQLRTLMSLPTLEQIFAQLAVEQDTEAITTQIMDLISL